jgi:sec-independent protein translocase protein TatC
MDERRMTIREHLEELRGRLLKSVVFVGLMLILCIVFMQELAGIVIDGPYKSAREMLVEDQALDPEKVDTLLMAGTFQAPFIAYFKLCFIVALFFASPFVGYQLWKFIGAGLYKHERKWVLIFAPFSFMLFVGGCLFGFFILIPLALLFLVKIADPNLVRPMFTVSEYLSLVTLLTIVLGAVFQLPLIMVFFAKIGLASWRGYLRYWKFAIVGVVIVGALLTPPDPVSQLLMAGPMLTLYFVGILLAALVRPKNREAPQTS